jgi:hypothetical protein
MHINNFAPYFAQQIYAKKKMCLMQMFANFANCVEILHIRA